VLFNHCELAYGFHRLLRKLELSKYRPSHGMVILLVYLILTSGIIYILFSQWAFDDPYITYRYAKNLANGEGFVYNSGLRVQSTTTPLFTILLALIYPISQELPRVANLLGALGIALGGIFIWDLAHTWNSPIVGWASLFLYPTFFFLLSTIGSETPVYIAFCLGAFAFYARKQYIFSALLSALCVLTRPDGLLIPLLLLADYFIYVRRPIPWKALLVFLVLTLVWFLFAWSYFGSPIPATLAAKQRQASMGDIQKFATGLLVIMQPYSQQWFFWLTCGLALLGIFWATWRARAWWLILAWTGLYFVAYTLLGVSRYFWYYAPLVPGLIIAAGLGAEALYHVMSARGWHASGILLTTAIILAIVIAQCTNLWYMSHRLDPRIGIYRAVGEWLKENTHPKALVGTLEVGAIGYYSDRPIVDFAGLIQPDVAMQLNKDTTYADSANWAVQHYRPEYIVLHQAKFPMLEKSYLAQSCQDVKRFNGSDYGYSQNLIVYACQ
jgi:hypothetical protein